MTIASGCEGVLGGRSCLTVEEVDVGTTAQLERSDATGGTAADSPIRGLLNWFGALFGLVVLVGGVVLYVTGEAAPEPGDGTLAVADVHEGSEPEDVPSEEPTVEANEDVPVVEQEPTGNAAGAADPADDGTDGVVEVEMVEFGYVPATIDLEAGVPVTLRFSNTGKLLHEAMVGDTHMQEEFASAGNHDDGGGDDHHGDLMAVTVEPGQTAELEVLIDEPGTWYFACHLPGHYEQGQVATINVTG